jgi:hypothetical protein
MRRKRNVWPVRPLPCVDLPARFAARVRRDARPAVPHRKERSSTTSSHQVPPEWDVLWRPLTRAYEQRRQTARDRPARRLATDLSRRANRGVAGCSPSTISREIARRQPNHTPARGHRPVGLSASVTAGTGRTRGIPAVAVPVEDELGSCWAPEQIAGWLRCPQRRPPRRCQRVVGCRNRRISTSFVRGGVKIPVINCCR